MAPTDPLEPTEATVSVTGGLGGDASPRAPADSGSIEAGSGPGYPAASPATPGDVTGAETVSASPRTSHAELVHRLRTPLNAALLWVRLIRSGTLEPPMVQRALETIEHNLCLQNMLLNDLADETEQEGP